MVLGGGSMEAPVSFVNGNNRQKTLPELICEDENLIPWKKTYHFSIREGKNPTEEPGFSIWN